MSRPKGLIQNYYLIYEFYETKSNFTGSRLPLKKGRLPGDVLKKI